MPSTNTHKTATLEARVSTVVEYLDRVLLAKSPQYGYRLFAAEPHTPTQ